MQTKPLHKRLVLSLVASEGNCWDGTSSTFLLLTTGSYFLKISVSKPGVD